MLALTCRVVRSSRLAGGGLIVPEPHAAPAPPPRATVQMRQTPARVPAAARPHLEPRRIDQTLAMAALLRPCQRPSVAQRYSVARIAERTGRTGHQVARLPRAGLATIAANGLRPPAVRP
jgi:hypothetical protein